MADDGLHVIGLSAKNYLTLSAVELALDADGLVVSGNNGQGKSSILSVLAAALGGKAMEPECPIKIGEHRAEIAVVLGNGGVKYRVSKVFEDGRASRLVVELADGSRAASPQKILDGLYEALSFDPGQFVNPPGAKTPAAAEKMQAEMLLQACPLDIDLPAHERKTEGVRNARTDANREVKRLETVMSSQRPETVPDAVDVSALSEALTAANKRRATIDEAKRVLPEIDAAVAFHEARIAESQKAIAEMRAKREKVAPWAVADAPDVAALQARISSAAETNTKRATALAANEALAVTRKALDVARKKADELDESVKALEQQKLDALERAAFPVKGLTVEGERLVMRSAAGALPFRQLNLSTQYVVAFHVLAKMHPKFRVAVIRDGNAFDVDHLHALFGVARDAGFQIIVERVAQDVPGAVVIEAGAVKGRVA